MYPRGQYWVLFNNFSNDLDGGTHADNTILGGVADSSEDYAAIQNDLERLENEMNLLKEVHKEKCKVVDEGRNNIMYQYMLGAA